MLNFVTDDDFCSIDASLLELLLLFDEQSDAFIRKYKEKTIRKFRNKIFNVIIDDFFLFVM